MNKLERNLTRLSEDGTSRKERERALYERERDCWLNLTPKVRAIYMQTAMTLDEPRNMRPWDKKAQLNWIVSQAQALAYAAEFPAFRI